MAWHGRVETREWLTPGLVRIVLGGTGLSGLVVPDDTDTRGIWYNKQLLQKAGIPVPWQPKTWADVIAAARKIKAKLPGGYHRDFQFLKAPLMRGIELTDEMLVMLTVAVPRLPTPAGPTNK